MTFSDKYLSRLKLFSSGLHPLEALFPQPWSCLSMDDVVDTSMSWLKTSQALTVRGIGDGCYISQSRDIASPEMDPRCPMITVFD